MQLAPWGMWALSSHVYGPNWAFEGWLCEVSVAPKYVGVAAPAGIDESLLEEGPERELYRELRGIQAQPIENVISRLRPKIDLFFDKVLVNAPDPAVRQNRLTLLQTLLAEFSTMADFSEIVTNS